MAFSLRKISKRFIIITNVVIALAFLLACLQPWLDPETFWVIGFLSLAFPYLLVVLVLFVFFWMVAKARYMFISLITILFAWKQIGVLFSLDKNGFKKAKVTQQLRVMSWNIKAFGGFISDRKAKEENAKGIFRLIDDMNADIVCFQEFGQYDTPSVKRNYVAHMKELGYENYVLSRDYSRVTFGYTSGLAIFSKIPIIQTKRIPFNSSAESVLYADVVFELDTFRIFTTHLQSFKFAGNDYRDIEKIRHTEDSLYEASVNIFTKMKRAFRNRSEQANMIRPLLDSCPYPEIICCDMNDVPTSYAYWKLRGQRKDAFLEKGFGIGRSFTVLAPTLRIDYILVDKRFDIMQFDILRKQYSDHLPIVADLKLTP